MMKLEVSGSKAYVYTPYNKEFVQKIKLIGRATWEPNKRCWRVPAETVNEVRVLMMDVYGETDQLSEEKVSVKLTFNEWMRQGCGDIILYGKTIASAHGRDSGAKVGDDVAFISGAPESSGSAKNWFTDIPEGSVCIVHNVPVTKLGEKIPDYIVAEVIATGDSRKKLIDEKEKLLKRIGEIDDLLKSME